MTVSKPMSMREIRDGLSILLKYEDNGECFIHHYLQDNEYELEVPRPKEVQVIKEDRVRLKESGWEWDTHMRCWTHQLYYGK
jgi:hypothetical protein